MRTCFVGKNSYFISGNFLFLLLTSEPVLWISLNSPKRLDVHLLLLCCCELRQCTALWVHSFSYAALHLWSSFHYNARKYQFIFWKAQSVDYSLISATVVYRLRIIFQLFVVRRLLHFSMLLSSPTMSRTTYDLSVRRCYLERYVW